MRPKKEHVVGNCVENYELQPPDGGWGYVVVVATVVVFVATIIPMVAFGLVFGKFLQTIGDETTGTTLTNGMFNTVNSFMGLVANGVLNKFSYRKVGIAGSLIYFSGAVGVIFTKNLFQLITFYGVIQGIGFGLLMPSTLTAFNSYFSRKMALMMSVAQAAMVAGNMIMPQLATWSMDTFGFRGTLILLAGFSLLYLPACASLQPVEWHLKKVPATKGAIVSDDDVAVLKKKSLPMEVLKPQMEPLINRDESMAVSQRSLNHHHISAKPRYSVISLGDRVASVTTINNWEGELHGENEDGAKKADVSFWQSLVKSMDMSLLRQPKYLNVSIVLALCFTADLAFISIIPLMLGNIGFEPRQIALMMAVYFGSDLVSRILLSVVSSVIQFRSRILVLCGAFLSAAFRTVLVYNDSLQWKISILAVLGFLRCFIQTPLTLVISEEYPDQFSSAFSLFMAVNGVVNLLFGPLMSVIKSYTQSDVMVCHLLTLAYALSTFAWTIDMIFCEKKKREK